MKKVSIFLALYLATQTLSCLGMKKAKYIKNYASPLLPKVKPTKPSRFFSQGPETIKWAEKFKSPDDFIKNYSNRFPDNYTQFIKDKSGNFWELTVDPNTKVISPEFTKLLIWDKKINNFREDRWYKVKKLFRLVKGPELAENGDFHYPKTTFGFAATSIKSREDEQKKQLLNKLNKVQNIIENIKEEKKLNKENKPNQQNSASSSSAAKIQKRRRYWLR